ncbi:MAG: GFA family protein, partial [Zetaproteobacteria bacterium CG02_land_8_20_14_3_00_50_9]
MIYQGGCHCGAIRFEVEAPEQFEAVLCNCSIWESGGLSSELLSSKSL